MSDLLSLFELQDGLVWTAALLDRQTGIQDSPGVRTPQLQRPEAKCECPWPPLCAVVEHEQRLMGVGCSKGPLGCGGRTLPALGTQRWHRHGAETQALLAVSPPQEPGLLGLGVPAWVPPGLSSRFPLALRRIL